jgi:hypothetical protein
MRSSINALHLRKLEELQYEPYYTGSRNLGERVPSQDGITSTNSVAAEEERILQAENDQQEEFETAADLITSIVD